MRACQGHGQRGGPAGAHMLHPTPRLCPTTQLPSSAPQSRTSTTCGTCGASLAAMQITRVCRARCALTHSKRLRCSLQAAACTTHGAQSEHALRERTTNENGGQQNRRRRPQGRSQCDGVADSMSVVAIFGASAPQQAHAVQNPAHHVAHRKGQCDWRCRSENLNARGNVTSANQGAARGSRLGEGVSLRDAGERGAMLSSITPSSCPKERAPCTMSSMKPE